MTDDEWFEDDAEWPLPAHLLGPCSEYKADETNFYCVHCNWAEAAHDAKID